tara:strand:- start:27299 stop:28657 length:1359 start_codon:yes stop_codon:yes gene_type:complete
MRQVTPAWKLLAAVLSLLLTVFVWQKGLQESFSRPSVAPKLSLSQQEMALVASPALPKSIKPFLVGLEPKNALKKTLHDIPLDQIEDRERIVLAAIEQTKKKRSELLNFELKDETLLLVQKAFLSKSNLDKLPLLTSTDFEQIKENDPLLYQVSCFALGGTDAQCINKRASSYMALRLLGVQGLPLIATIVGVGLLIRQAWMRFQKKSIPWPRLTPIPLSSIDMVLLVAGGFVVLGEVLLPTFVVPLSSYLTKDFSGPVNDSFKVFVGYSAMTLPPLFLLRQQLNSLRNLEPPNGGWLQWRLKPIQTAICQAINGWLMVMPFVLLSGLLMNFFIGDQGGSNPLLELVLSSHNNLALLLLLATTVILAPAFEELIFRGALLPVIAGKLGVFWGIIVSAFVFALAHLSVGELPPLFVLGLGLGILRISSGRLFPCAIMHSLWNGITFANLLLLG